VDCLLRAHARRGTSPLSCCDEQVASHQVLVGGLVEGDIIRYEVEEEVQPDDDTMKKFHPVKWLKKKKGGVLQRDPEDGGKVQISVLYLCTMIKESNRMRAHCNIATLARVGNNNISEEDCNDICDLFSAIKTVIVPPSVMSKEQVAYWIMD